MKEHLGIPNNASLLFILWPIIGLRLSSPVKDLIRQCMNQTFKLEKCSFFPSGEIKRGKKNPLPPEYFSYFSGLTVKKQAGIGCA